MFASQYWRTAVIKWFSVLAFFVAIAKSCVVIGVCTIISFFLGSLKRSCLLFSKRAIFLEL